jgi:hypothetical protein
MALLAPCQVARAVNNMWIGPNLGNWNVSANWSVGVAPDRRFNEAAVIDNFTTAVLSAPASSDGVDVNVAGLKLGLATGSFGGLRITNGGNLPNVASVIGNPMETGAIAIGVAGHGDLVVLGGGAISGASLSLAGAAGSSMTLGDASGLAATVAVSGAADLLRTTTLIGPNVNFGAAGTLTFTSASTLIADIRHPTIHSPLKASGAAALSGTFKPMFTGVTPAPGNAWNIIDAASITGAFTLDASAAPALPAGQAYQLSQADGGANGKLLRLSVVEMTFLPADFDEDLDVDGDDLARWRTNFGAAGSATHMQGDANADGDVDGADYLVWQQQFHGNPAAARAAAQIPEPTTQLAAAACLASLAPATSRPKRRCRRPAAAAPARVG